MAVFITFWLFSKRAIFRWTKMAKGAWYCRENSVLDSRGGTLEPIKHCYGGFPLRLNQSLNKKGRPHTWHSRQGRGTTQKRPRELSREQQNHWSGMSWPAMNIFFLVPNDTFFLLIWLVLLVPPALFYTCYRVLLSCLRSINVELFPIDEFLVLRIGRWSILTVMKFTNWVKTELQVFRYWRKMP